MNSHINKKFTLSPITYITLGFLAVILFGGLLLTLPISSQNGQWLNFVDALFTAVSAVCVTGLTVVDTTLHYTIFGQIIIILLIQIGGLGIMTITTLVFFSIRKRITLKDRIAMQQSVGGETLDRVVVYIRNLLITTFVIETAGAIALLPVFIPQYGAIGIFKAIFISISSFCNAGFDILGGAHNPIGSLTVYSNNVIVILTVSFLIILGGLGFSVIMDVLKKRNARRYLLHTKIVLWTTAILVLSGTVLFAIAEWNNSATFGSMPFGEKLLNAFMMSVTPRTAGFYSIDINGLTLPSKFLTLFLMFIGASPASTGGGIKTTTIVVLLFMIIAGIKSQNKIVINKKQIGAQIYLRAVAVTVIFALIIFLITTGLMMTESSNIELIDNGKYTMETLLFETMSAMGTVGLTLGTTPLLSAGGKILIMMTMFAGRLGPLTIGLIFMKNFGPLEKIEYPEDNIMIG